MTAAVAGVLVAPLTLTGATMGAVLGLKAFAVAIIGGLNSGMGVIVGGLIADLALSIIILPTFYVWFAKDTDKLPEPEESSAK